MAVILGSIRTVIVKGLKTIDSIETESNGEESRSMPSMLGKVYYTYIDENVSPRRSIPRVLTTLIPNTFGESMGGFGLLVEG